MEGPTIPPGIHTPERAESVSPAHKYVYLQVVGETGQVLPQGLFTKDIIVGLFRTQNMGVGLQALAPVTPTQVYVLGDTEAVLELREDVDLERIMINMAALEWWIGQRVKITCRGATQSEVEAGRTKDELESIASHPDRGEERFLKMMENFATIASKPAGDALKIPTFSGTIPLPKDEATFAQWAHEVREALAKYPEATVRSWVSRSLKGSPADNVRTLGPRASVNTILQKLETMHGAVYPLDVMMKKLFSISQGKVEIVSTYATRLETAMANIERDHPMQLPPGQQQASLRDRFYQGLKKTYKDSLRYLYDSGASYEQILKAARKAEAEVDGYKELDPAPAKSAQGNSLELLNEMAAIKAIVNQAWKSQKDPQKKQFKKGGGQKDGQNKQTSSKRGACFGCGKEGHFIKDCPLEQTLNSKGGDQKKKKKKVPPAATATSKKEASTSTLDEDPQEEEEPEDGQEQD